MVTPPTADSPTFFEKIAANERATLYQHAADQASATLVLFLAFDPQAPAQLSLQESWEQYPGDPRARQNGGCYLFLTQPPTADFLARALQYIDTFNQQFTFAYRYCLWIGEQAAQSLSGPWLAFTTSGAPGSVVGAVIQQADLDLRNLHLVIDASVRMYADFDPVQLRFEKSVFAELRLEDRAGPVAVIGVFGPGAALPLDSAAAGSLRYTLQMRVTSGPSPDDFSNLSVGLKYFYQRNGRIVSQLYPLFGGTLDRQPIPFAAGFDPLYPLDHDRTFFTFAPPEGVTPSAFESRLRTQFGHALTLTPSANVSKLVLQPDRLTIHGPLKPQTDTYYVAPLGPFLIDLQRAPAAASAPPQLLCGLSGLETIDVTPPQPTARVEAYAGDTITFHPDLPALANVFPLQTVTIDASNADPIDCSGGGAPPLSGDFTTSWVSVTSLEPGAQRDPVYRAQPDGSALYAIEQGVGALNPDFLGYYQPITALLRSADTRYAFPLTAYAATIVDAEGFDVFSGQDVRDFEFQLLAPQRRSIIQRMPQSMSALQARLPVTASGFTTATTPQGFLVDVNDDGSWRRLLLATVSWQSAGNAPPETYRLQFRDLNPTLQGAFQSNQLFLVVTQPNPCWQLGAPPANFACDQPTIFDNFLKLESWPFQVNTGVSNTLGDYNNVLIFKFCDGALIDKVRNPRQWTNPCAFNSQEPGALDAVSQWLQDYIADAQRNVDSGSDRAYFQNFIDIVTSPSWQGVLALRVNINLEQFPAELQGLLAGIDLSRFFAHHLGVELSFVKNVQDGSTRKLQPEGSTSLFGLIYYLDPAFQAQLASEGSAELPVTAPLDVDYNFKVLTLKVLFKNSEITDFASKTQITLNRLFGDQTVRVTTRLGPAISNSVVLDGSYESHDGQGVYVFNTSSDNKFWLNGNLWNYVEFVKAQFNTLNTQRSASSDVQARFVFWGYLNFQEPQGFDAISFGSESGQAETDINVGLSFANLYLEMSFNVETPSAVSYRFNPDDVTFAPGQSVARKGSLYQHFPISITRLLYGTKEKLPSQQGYLRVATNQLRSAPLGDTWFGFEFDLNMGTPGALVAAVGFTSQLFIGWSPNSAGPGYKLFIGIKLPGAGNGEAKLLSLQGVLRLTVQQIQFFRTSTASGDPAYILRLTNILLSILGVSFPPGTSTLFFLFGDPRPGSARDSLGWYASINREPKPPALSDETLPPLLSAASAAPPALQPPDE